MQLIMSPASPFVRCVRVQLRETDMLARVEEVEVATTPLASDSVALAANPTGKIPALTRADGPAIYDSRVICRYLDDMADTNLYPNTSLYEVLTLEATAHAIMDAAVSMSYEVRVRPETQQSSDWIKAQWGKVARGCGAINSRWMSHLHGPLNGAQIAVGCALGYLDLRHDALGWRTENGSLAAWFAEFEQRTSMQDTKVV